MASMPRECGAYGGGGGGTHAGQSYKDRHAPSRRSPDRRAPSRSPNGREPSRSPRGREVPKSPEVLEYERAMEQYHKDMREYEEKLLPAYLASEETYTRERRHTRQPPPQQAPRDDAAGQAASCAKPTDGGRGGGGERRPPPRTGGATASDQDTSVWEQRARGQPGHTDGRNPMLPSGGGHRPERSGQGQRSGGDAAGEATALGTAAGVLSEMQLSRPAPVRQPPQNRGYTGEYDA